jgi:aryl-alcohol dehydrogenase-like predicted oxidoreductase
MKAVVALELLDAPGLAERARKQPELAVPEVEAAQAAESLQPAAWVAAQPVLEPAAVWLAWAARQPGLAVPSLSASQATQASSQRRAEALAGQAQAAEQPVAGG